MGFVDDDIVTIHFTRLIPMGGLTQTTLFGSEPGMI
jgi:hypothetical protein